MHPLVALLHVLDGIFHQFRRLIGLLCILYGLFHHFVDGCGNLLDGAGLLRGTLCQGLACAGHLGRADGHLVGGIADAAQNMVVILNQLFQGMAQQVIRRPGIHHHSKVALGNLLGNPGLILNVVNHLFVLVNQVAELIIVVLDQLDVHMSLSDPLGSIRKLIQRDPHDPDHRQAIEHGDGNGYRHDAKVKNYGDFIVTVLIGCIQDTLGAGNGEICIDNRQYHGNYKTND